LQELALQVVADKKVEHKIDLKVPAYAHNCPRVFEI